MEDVKESELDLVVAGTSEGVLMVESQANELAEDVMLGAVNFGHDTMKPVIELIISLAELCAKDPFELEEPPPELEIVTEKFSTFSAELENAYKIQIKQDRQKAIENVKTNAINILDEKYTFNSNIDYRHNLYTHDDSLFLQ